MNRKTKTPLWFGKLKEQIKYHVHMNFKVINPSRPNSGQRENVKLNFIFTFL